MITSASAVQTTDAADLVDEVRRSRGAVLVHVWATWCGACRNVHDDVNQLVAEYQGKGLSVVGVAVDADPAAVDRYEGAHPTQWDGRCVRGGAGIAAAITALGGRYPGAVPYDLLLDEHGQVVAQWTGGIGATRMRERVQSALPDVPHAAPVQAVAQGRVHIVFAGHEGEPVSIDGWNAGVLPLDTELVAGPHLFRVQGAQSRVDVHAEVILEAGRVVEVDLATAPSPVPEAP